MRKIFFNCLGRMRSLTFEYEIKLRWWDGGRKLRIKSYLSLYKLGSICPNTLQIIFKKYYPNLYSLCMSSRMLSISPKRVVIVRFIPNIFSIVILYVTCNRRKYDVFNIYLYTTILCPKSLLKYTQNMFYKNIEKLYDFFVSRKKF